MLLAARRARRRFSRPASRGSRVLLFGGGARPLRAEDGYVQLKSGTIVRRESVQRGDTVSRWSL
jgi:hypothetical protein